MYEMRPDWEARLDELVRPALLVEPPADVQHAWLAAVLAATAAEPRPFARTVAAPASAGVQGVPLAAYVLLAGVLVAYFAVVSWVHALLGSSTWLTALFEQLLAVSQLWLGRLPTGEPLGLAWLLLQRAPWIVLLPVGWLLWERDRAATRTA